MQTITLIDQTKLLVIDDHPIVRDSCVRLCARRPDVLVKEASTAAEGLAANRDFRPNVVILDISLGNTSGFDLIPTLFSENPETRIVVFSMYEEARFVTRALDLGAHGYITKSDDPNSILAAIDKVRSGDIYFGLAAGRAVALANFGASRDRIQDLTERERQVVARLGEGKSLTEIAVELDIGYKSAAAAVANAKRKLGFTSSAALIRFAVERQRFK